MKHVLVRFLVHCPDRLHLCRAGQIGRQPLQLVLDEYLELSGAGQAHKDSFRDADDGSQHVHGTDARPPPAVMAGSVGIGRQGFGSGHRAGVETILAKMTRVLHSIHNIHDVAGRRLGVAGIAHHKGRGAAYYGGAVATTSV